MKRTIFGCLLQKMMLVSVVACFTASLWAGEKPNVVIVITDDQGHGDLSCHGNPVLETPEIDALYEESIHLTDYHVSPTCAPTRGALMSGHYTNRAGPWHTVMGRSFLKVGQTTLGEIFKENGYATGLFGKWHLGDNFPFRPEDRGFEEVVSHAGGGVGQTPDFWDNSYFNDTYMHNGVLEKYEGYCTDIFFSEAKSFMEKSIDEGKPFLAYISTNAPHGPMHCPEKYFQPYLDKGVTPHVAVFFGMIANIDENVGNLRTWLDQKGVAENTIFIFTTDNGTASGNKVFNSLMRGKKASEYEGGHRVPFFIHWPKGGLIEKRDIDHVTAHIDVLPTLMELCALNGPLSYSFDGRSLSPLLFENPVHWPERVLVVDNQRVVDPVKWKNCSVMTDEWRLVNGKELYAIDRDPGQERDISAQHPDIVEQLRLQYEKWWASMEDSFGESARIIVGSDDENPSALTAHDWIMKDEKVAWHQSHIRKGAGGLGFWNLEVAQSGEYQISLSRYPREAKAAINQNLEPGDPVPGLVAYRETPGVGFDVSKAMIRLDDNVIVAPVATHDHEVSFKVELEKGDLSLASWFEDEAGEKYSAYYAYVEKL